MIENYKHAYENAQARYEVLKDFVYDFFNAFAAIKLYEEAQQEGDNKVHVSNFDIDKVNRVLDRIREEARFEWGNRHSPIFGCAHVLIELLERVEKIKKNMLIPWETE